MPQRHGFDARLNRLREKHILLEVEISQEEARPLPDAIIVRLLKRRRLLLKEEIIRFEAAAKSGVEAIDIKRSDIERREIAGNAGHRNGDHRNSDYAA